MAKMMIGELGNRTGTKVNTIRYYEDIGILPPPVRTDSGRRTYAECDVKRLSFIRHSRSFGFSLAEIRSLLSLSDSPEQDCTLASTIAKSHLERIDMKISQLEGLRHLVPVGERRIAKSLVHSAKFHFPSGPPVPQASAQQLSGLIFHRQNLIRRHLCTL